MARALHLGGPSGANARNVFGFAGESLWFVRGLTSPFITAFKLLLTLHTSHGSFLFTGTKDKRGLTSQFITAFKLLTLHTLVNSFLPGTKDKRGLTSQSISAFKLLTLHTSHDSILVRHKRQARRHFSVHHSF